MSDDDTRIPEPHEHGSTASHFYALHLDTGQLLPATTDEANLIRQCYVRSAMSQRAYLDSRTLDGRKLLDGGYTQAEIDAATGGDPRHAEWTDPKHDEYANMPPFGKITP